MRMTTDDDRVFKALADPTRRFLLDRLFTRDGRTLTELESELEMTRFGVMKHLRVLEDAGLVVARRSGREKLHYLNPVPIRLIHDRWIDKYTERQVSALARSQKRTGGDGMTSTEQATLTTTQVYRIYIRATPEAIWDAITNPDWNEKYGYPGRGEFDLRPGGKYLATADEQAQAMGMPAELVDGEVIEVDPPRKLVQTWHALWPELVDEKPTRVTWEIEDEVEGISRLTVTHELEGAPKHAEQVASATPLIQGGGGWAWILSDLKTLLETGKASYGIGRRGGGPARAGSPPGLMSPGPPLSRPAPRRAVRSSRRRRTRRSGSRAGTSGCARMRLTSSTTLWSRSEIVSQSMYRASLEPGPLPTSRNPSAPSSAVSRL